MNLKILLLFLFFVHFSCILPLSAQVEENFADSDLSRDPVWRGDLDKFAIRRYSEKYYQLDLNDVQKGSAAIVTSSGLVRNTEWKFHFQVNGKSLTKGSYARFYLAIDTLDWYGNVQGYYVDFGSNDGWIALVRQDGSSRDTVILVDSHNETKLCATSSLDLWITCSQEGEWSFNADVGNGEYALWGKKMDTTYVTSKYVGILCVYTKTNSMNFSFADISVKKWKNTESENPGQEGNRPSDGEHEDTEGEEEAEDSSSDEKQLSPMEEEGFYLEYNSFTPDGDGIRDELGILYCLPEKGYMVKLSVYDASGRKVREWETIELQQSEGTLETTSLRWEGKNDMGDVVPVGIYILFLEAYHPSGGSFKKKWAVAVTR